MKIFFVADGLNLERGFLPREAVISYRRFGKIFTRTFYIALPGKFYSPFTPFSPYFSTDSYSYTLSPSPYLDLVNNT